MNKNILIIALTIFVLIANNVSAQEEKKSEFGIKLSGYVKNDFFFDTRQTVSAREGHLLFWPSPEKLDENGVDINDKSNFNFLAVQSRLKADVFGPDALGAKTSGAIEGEFFGHTNADINGFRLRHAYIKFDWGNAQLLTGQTWHPMFILECFPGTVSFNTGLSYAPFSRNPQIKFSYNLGNLKLSATAYSERDFTSYDINGVPSSNYIRNTGIPSFNLHLNYGIENIKTGFALNYHSMLPSLTTSANYVTNQTVKSFSGLAYVNAQVGILNFKLSGAYCENPTGMMMPGGYAVLDVVNAETGELSYIPIRSFAGWIDVSAKVDNFRFGVFAGYNKNLGTSKSINGDFGGFATDIHHLYRVSPRIDYFAGKIQIGAEIECSVAAFGDGTYNDRAQPIGYSESLNIRYILGIYYHF